jgi:hypothetical protein
LSVGTRFKKFTKFSTESVSAEQVKEHSGNLLMVQRLDISSPRHQLRASWVYFGYNIIKKKAKILSIYKVNILWLALFRKGLSTCQFLLRNIK